MKKVALFLVGMFVVSLASTGCKTEFEKLRAGGEPEVLYQKAMEYYEKEEFLKAQTLFELIINSYRGKKEAEEIYFHYAYTHFHLNKFILASYYFKNFSNTYINSPFREEAEFMSAYSNYQLSPSYRLDQSYTEKAIDGLQTFVNTFPNSSRVQESNRLIDEMRRKLERKAFSQAMLYYNLKQYQSAVHSFENLLKDFPETPEAMQVRFMIVKSNYLLASNSVYSKQEERFQATLKSYELFKNKYQNSEYDKELENIYQATTEKLKNLING